MILKNATTAEMRAMAQTEGMKTLRQAGLMKVLEGTDDDRGSPQVTLS